MRLRCSCFLFIYSIHLWSVFGILWLEGFIPKHAITRTQFKATVQMISIFHLLAIVNFITDKQTEFLTLFGFSKQYPICGFLRRSFYHILNNGITGVTINHKTHKPYHKLSGDRLENALRLFFLNLLSLPSFLLFLLKILRKTLKRDTVKPCVYDIFLF